MTRSVVIAIAGFAILAAGAVGHGLRLDRWGEPAKLQEAAAKLKSLPMKIGDWDGEESALDPRQAEMTEASGILVRRYQHRYDRHQASIMILCGRPGPISVHPPEACYGGAGYVPGPASVHKLPEGGELWVAEFKKSGPTPETLRIHWGWSDGTRWVASESPRTEFFTTKLLYKMYVIQPIVPSRDGKGSPETQFLDAVMPELKNCLVTTP